MSSSNPGPAVPAEPGRVKRLWLAFKAGCARGWQRVRGGGGYGRRFSWGNVFTLMFLAIVCLGVVGGGWFLSGYDSPGLLVKPSKNVVIKAQPATVAKVDLGPVVTNRLDGINGRLAELEKISAQTPASPVVTPSAANDEVVKRLDAHDQEISALHGNDEMNEIRNKQQDATIAALLPSPARPPVVVTAPTDPPVVGAPETPEVEWLLKNVKFAFLAGTHESENVVDGYVATMVDTSRLEKIMGYSAAEKAALKRKVAYMTDEKWAPVFLARLGIK